MEWDDKKTILLIQEYEKRRLLWDKDHKHYRNARRRKKHMNEIAKILKVDMIELRKKLNSLHNISQQKIENLVQLQEQSETGSEDANASKWVGSLRFLWEGQKPAAKWDDAKTELLIKEYEKRRLLWDKNHPHYYNHKLKKAHIKKISNIVNMHVVEIKKKIVLLLASLRVTNKKLRELEENEGVKGGDEVFIPKWFDSLQFVMKANEKEEVVDWDNDKTMLLIKEYKKRRMLWDKCHEHYYSTNARRKYMNELANLLKINITEIRKKITCFQKIFADGIKKIEDIKKNAATESMADMKSKWFPHLQFLSERSQPEMTKLEWDDSRTVLLIEEYKKRRLLWDKNHNDYHNNNMRKKEMNELADIVKADKIQVRRKIKYLLYMFWTGKKKLQELQEKGELEGDKEGYKPKWFDNMQFLSEKENTMETDEKQLAENGEWNDDKVTLLIQEYRKRRLLWDKNHKYHRNCKIKKRHLNEVADIVKIDVAEVRRKISQLIQTFRIGEKKLQILQEKGDLGGDKELYKPKWFDSLQFLSENLKPLEEEKVEPLKWDDDKTIHLIQQYKKRRVLWDKSHKFYKNNKIREIRMNELANTLEVDVAELKKKIEYLYHIFLTGRNKLQGLQGKGDLEDHPEINNLKWFENLQFLSEKHKSMGRRKTELAKWGDEKTMFFIQEYQKRRSLWDKNHEDYLNKEIRSKLITELANIVNINVAETKIKIKRILDIFREEKKKIEDLEKQGDMEGVKAMYKSKWFTKLQFLSVRYNKSVWDDNRTMLLIYEYQKRTVLWDKNHEQYQNRTLKGVLLNEVATTLGVDVKELRSKLREIRSNKMRKLGELGKSKIKGDGETLQPKWSNNLQFLSEPINRGKITDWDESRYKLLIQEYRRRRSLWDTSHKHYKNIIIRKKLLHELALILDVDILTIKKKVSFIISTFWRGKRKLKQMHKKGATEGYERVFQSKWYESLQFLSQREKSDKSNGAGEDIEMTEAYENFNYDCKITAEDKKPCVVQIENQFDDPLNGFQMNLLHEDVPYLDKMSDYQNWNKMESNYSKSHHYEECEDFGHHVADELRKFTGINRAIVMHIINNLIYRTHVDVMDVA